MRILAFGGPSAVFFRGKNQLWAKFSTMFSNSGLLFLSGKGHGKVKTIRFIAVHIIIGEDWLNNDRETLVQIGIKWVVFWQTTDAIRSLRLNICSRKENKKS